MSSLRIPDFKSGSIKFSYIVLGTGRQGIAAAYDLGRFGEARRITVALSLIHI